MTFRRMSFIAALVAALVASGVAYAQPGPPAGQRPAQPSGQPPVPQTGPQPGQGPQAGGPPPAPGLQLTEEQRTKISSLVIEQRDRARLAQATMQSLEHQLTAELFADKPDEVKIKQLRGDLLKAQQEMVTARFDQQARIAQILTPEQRKRARDLRAQRLLMGAPGEGPGMGRMRRGMRQQGFGPGMQGPGGPGVPGAGPGAGGFPGRGMRQPRQPGVDPSGQAPGAEPAGRLPWWLREDLK